MERLFLTHDRNNKTMKKKIAISILIGVAAIGAYMTYTSLAELKKIGDGNYEDWDW